MAYPMQGRTADGQSVFVLVDDDGRLIVSGGSGGGGGGGGIIGTDTAGTQWIMVVDTTATPATVTYFKVSDGTTGTPVGGFTPDSDQNGATATKQDTQTTELQAINADIGTPADAAATSDAGTFSLTALFKRALGNWTTLLARIPALVSGRIPVDGSGVVQPVQPTVVLPASWPGTSYDARNLGTVTITCLTAPTTAYTLQWSADNTNWNTVTGVTLALATTTTVSAVGAVSIPGNGYVRLSGGTGGTFTLGALA